MSELEKKNGSLTASEESVDDILAGILNADGTFNDEFNGLLSRYMGVTQETVRVPDVDLSDRSGEETVSAKDQPVREEARSARVLSVDERIEEKMPDSVREVYSEASSDAQRPEFTSTGDVKYPSMGVGESEQRVVFDADWEETAKKEAARLERVRQDRLLRGDSAYARGYMGGSMYIPQQSRYMNAPGTNSLYIDPLSNDDDFDRGGEKSEYYSSQKKSFFPEGFSVVQKNNYAAGGKTEKRNGGNNIYSNSPGSVSRKSTPDADWLKVEEKKDKKKKRFGRKKDKSVEEPVRAQMKEEYEELLENEQDSLASVSENTEAENEIREEVSVRHIAYDTHEIDQVADETRGLRSTVAEIVDKYNKRSEEEAKRRQEEQARLEEIRREEELRERRRQEELRKIKKELSPELVSAIDSEEEDFFDEYEDFSTEPSAVKREQIKAKTFGIVFDPVALDGKDYLEKLADDEKNEDVVTEKIPAPAEEEKTEEKKSGSDNNKSKGKKKSAKNRRKDS